MEEAEQHDLVRPGSLDHGVKIADIRLEGESQTFRCDPPSPAPVVLDESDPTAQVRERTPRSRGLRHSPSTFENGTPGRWINVGPSPMAVHAMRAPSAAVAVASVGSTRPA